jgi:GT2 family glycosyltransferase
VLLSVAYHSQGALERLAADLARQSFRPGTWLVVDNSPESAPLNAQTLGQSACPCAASGKTAGGRAAGMLVELLRGREGDGFGAGCNRGLAHLARQGWRGWVWLLNPDIALPMGNEVERLAEALAAQPDQAVVGTAVLDPDGRIEPSGGWIDPGLNFRRRRLGAGTLGCPSMPLPLDWLSGCSLVFRPEAHVPPARFDPAFPLYYEDMDLCLRLARGGAPVLWLPEPAVIHQRGEGSQTPRARRLRLSTLSYLRFLRRHRPGWVLLLRTLRLLLTTLLRLPLRPRRSLAVLAALIEACR